MDRVYGVMLIGCGHIGEEHLADIYYRDNVRIEAVVDQQPERAVLFARKYGARHSGTDYRPFLDSKAVDIVIIATYANTHLPILEDCLAAGKHVLCEKPIADSLENGRRFYALVKASPCKVLVAHILRHNRSYQKLAELIASGVIGEVRLMRMVQNHHALDWPRYKRLMEDCSPIVDCGVHYLDVMQWFTGVRICEVSGFGGRVDDDLDRSNYGMIHARLENGCIGFTRLAGAAALRQKTARNLSGTRDGLP